MYASHIKTILGYVTVLDPELAVGDWIGEVILLKQILPIVVDHQVREVGRIQKLVPVLQVS